MPSLLLVVFVLQVLVHSINSIDGTVLGEILWIWYNKLPTPTSATVKKTLKSRNELIRLKRELGNVSAQDDFAKWAKLQRQHDKVYAEHEKISSSVNSTKSTFITLIKTTRFLTCQVGRFVFQWWFQKEPMFWLPAGALPWYIEWILSFPKAPMGSVSVQAWWMACVSVIFLASEGATAAWNLATGVRGNGTKRAMKEEPMAFESKDAKKEKTPNGKSAKTKKEL